MQQDGNELPWGRLLLAVVRSLPFAGENVTKKRDVSEHVLLLDVWDVLFRNSDH